VVSEPAATAFVSATEDLLVRAARRFAPRLAFATGFGPEGLVLLDMIARLGLRIDVFTLDTGLFFPETYALWRRLEERYALTIRAVRPGLSVAAQEERHGQALWSRNPERCCGIRKHDPLAEALRGHAAWITAIRADQTPERARARGIGRDPRLRLVKINPLLAWTSDQVWSYLREHDVPTNPLHERGYPSIGCWPCTTPALPGEDARAGRWRGQDRTECGLHRAKGAEVAMTQDLSSFPVPPHGGRLVDRIVPAPEADALRSRAETLPFLELDARELADLELIATGAASPLIGFLGSADYHGVVERLRLADGTVWPLPFTLAVPDAARDRVRAGSEVALRDAGGRIWGVVQVEEVFERDPLHEARHVYGTEDKAHPGVAYLLSRPTTLAGGPVRVLPLPDDLPFAEHRLTPRELRALIAERGWRRVAGFQTRNPIHRAHEHLTKLALEFADGLVIHPLVGETKNDDVPAAVRFQAYETLLESYYPRARTLLAAFPAAMRYAGPREALFHALARKNYGITHLIVGRDHAGVGGYYGPYDAQRIFDRFPPEELGVSPLRFEPTFYCHACEALASPRTCPHDESSRLELSGTRVREVLRSGGRLPVKFTRPEVAEVLRTHYARDVEPAPAAPRAGRQGFIVWFTGLSGSGKSTLAQALRTRLADERVVEILDGDEVRAHLSKGLGFSKEDRDTNVARIGYVARLLARNGLAVVTAAISPYREARDEVRRLAAEDGTPFLEVFASAPVAALAARDVKGLYRKALSGEIAHFTGVSDPYEPPLAAEVTIHSDREGVVTSLGRILGALEERGLLGVLEGRAS
jgi:sulfate adenylyltransferase